MTMTQATPTLRHPNRCRNRAPEVLAEQAEAAAMIAELVRVLRRTGRYNVREIARRCADQGIPIAERQLVRWFQGHAAPYTIDVVERVAHVAGIDNAYLMIGGRR